MDERPRRAARLRDARQVARSEDRPKREAKPLNPVLVAGGGIEGGANGVAQPQTDFIHNSTRPPGGAITPSGVADGNVG